jgi:hypothetical protein
MPQNHGGHQSRDGGEPQLQPGPDVRREASEQRRGKAVRRGSLRIDGSKRSVGENWDWRAGGVSREVIPGPRRLIFAQFNEAVLCPDIRKADEVNVALIEAVPVAMGIGMIYRRDDRGNYGDFFHEQ